MVETNLKQLKCGGCENELHKLYIRTTGEILVECTECNSVSIIYLPVPTGIGSAMSSGGFGTTHYQNTTNDNTKHKRPITHYTRHYL
jgi:uncharacterized Zn finger protein